MQAGGSTTTTRYYTQGCDKLLIGTDHKPLFGVLNDRCLDWVDNPRLIHLKEKTFGWRFRIIHIPGRKLCGPNALSRAVAPGQQEVQTMTWGQGDTCIAQPLSIFCIDIWN